MLKPIVECNTEWFGEDFAAEERESEATRHGSCLDEIDTRQGLIDKTAIVEGHTWWPVTGADPCEHFLHSPLERPECRIQQGIKKTGQP